MYSDDEYTEDDEKELTEISEDLCLTENTSNEALESAIDSVRIKWKKFNFKIYSNI